MSVRPCLLTKEVDIHVQLNSYVVILKPCVYIVFYMMREESEALPQDPKTGKNHGFEGAS